MNGESETTGQVEPTLGQPQQGGRQSAAGRGGRAPRGKMGPCAARADRVSVVRGGAASGRRGGAGVLMAGGASGLGEVGRP